MILGCLLKQQAIKIERIKNPTHELILYPNKNKSITPKNCTPPPKKMTVTIRAKINACASVNFSFSFPFIYGRRFQL